MDLIRFSFDNFYDLIKHPIFYVTRKDPEIAHNLFVSFSQILSAVGLEKFVLDNKVNRKKQSFDISNAAGFNKNADISPTVLKYLGFDRVVIGTVTKDAWEGNPRPRIIRYSKTKSLVNWMGLPGIGAEKVAKRLSNYGNHEVPITINLMATPNKKEEQILRDLEGTIIALRDNHYVDRFELNISCLNVCNHTRDEYKKQLVNMLQTMESFLHPHQNLYLKISPDLNEREIEDTLEIISHYRVNGFTLTNTTTNHKKEFILKSPKKGGASGNAVYDDSLRVQKKFHEKLKYTDKEIIACGGINSIPKVKERLSFGAKEIQIFTPIIFSGPKLLRKFKEYKAFLN